MLVSLRRVGEALLRLRREVVVLGILAWMGLIWTLSNQEPSDEPSTEFWNWLSNSAHAPLFGLLALWAALLLPRRADWPRFTAASVALLLAFVVGYGLLDEFHQSHVPGRDPALTDVLTDLTGAACTLWIIAYTGTPSATERGLRARFALGIFACGLAGATANWA